jgi:hypothetical protein
MEWLTTRQLRLQSVGEGTEQAQAAAFHPTQAILAVAVGRNIIEFDALTGCKLSSVDIGGSVVKLAYSPAGGHVLLAVLQVRSSVVLPALHSDVRQVLFTSEM